MISLILNRGVCGCIMSSTGLLVTVSHYLCFIENTFSEDEKELLEVLSDKFGNSLDKTLEIAAQRLRDFKTVEELNAWRLTIMDTVEISEQELELALKAYDLFLQGLQACDLKDRLWYYEDIGIHTGHSYAEIAKCFERLRVVKTMLDENRIPEEPIILGELSIDSERAAWHNNMYKDFKRSYLVSRNGEHFEHVIEEVEEIK